MQTRQGRQMNHGPLFAVRPAGRSGHDGTRCQAADWSTPMPADRGTCSGGGDAVAGGPRWPAPRPCVGRSSPRCSLRGGLPALVGGRPAVPNYRAEALHVRGRTIYGRQLRGGRMHSPCSSLSSANFYCHLFFLPFALPENPPEGCERHEVRLLSAAGKGRPAGRYPSPRGSRRRRDGSAVAADAAPGDGDSR